MNSIYRDTPRGRNTARVVDLAKRTLIIPDAIVLLSLGKLGDRRCRRRLLSTSMIIATDRRVAVNKRMKGPLY
jgi:hypothetical protein